MQFSPITGATFPSKGVKNGFLTPLPMKVRKSGLSSGTSFSCHATHDGQKITKEAAFQPLLAAYTLPLRNKNEGAAPLHCIPAHWLAHFWLSEEILQILKYITAFLHFFFFPVEQTNLVNRLYI